MTLPCVCPRNLRVLLLAALMLAAQPSAAETVDFDDLTLDDDSYWNGPDPDGDTVDGPFGPEVHGTFESRNVQFVNRSDQTFGSWNGFAYSNKSDTTTVGVGNQFSAYTGTGFGPGDDNYGVAFGYLDLQSNDFQPEPFDPADPAQLSQLPNLELPDGYEVTSMYVTNTTYAAISILNGDSFAKRFGGPTGNDPDFFMLSAFGTDAAGQPLSSSVEFYLADYRFADNSLDYVVTDWASMDLSSLNGAKRVYFNLSSSDSGQFGLNTPPYFAVDNIQITPVPEPSSALLSVIGGVAVLALASWRRRR